MNIEDRLVIINGVLFNEARPPRFRVDPGPTFLGRGTVFQSCLIFCHLYFGHMLQLFFQGSGTLIILYIKSHTRILFRTFGFAHNKELTCSKM